MSNATTTPSGKRIGRTFEYGTRRPAAPAQIAPSGKVIGKVTR